MSALPLAAVMPVLLKDDLLWMAEQFGMTVPKSKKKETIAQMENQGDRNFYTLYTLLCA